MESTCTAARERLSELAPGLNPEMYARYETQLTEAETAARAQAHDYLTEWCNDVDGPSTAALTDLCATRDDAQALIAAITEGRLTAREADESFKALQRRHRSARQQHQRLTTMVDRVEQIAEDPIAFSDSLYERFPALTRPIFDF